MAGNPVITNIVRDLKGVVADPSHHDDDFLTAVGEYLSTWPRVRQFCQTWPEGTIPVCSEALRYIDRHSTCIAASVDAACAGWMHVVAMMVATAKSQDRNGLKKSIEQFTSSHENTGLPPVPAFDAASLFEAVDVDEEYIESRLKEVRLRTNRIVSLRLFIKSLDPSGLHDFLRDHPKINWNGRNPEPDRAKRLNCILSHRYWASLFAEEPKDGQSGSSAIDWSSDFAQAFLMHTLAHTSRAYSGTDVPNAKSPAHRSTISPFLVGLMRRLGGNHVEAGGFYRRFWGDSSGSAEKPPPPYDTLVHAYEEQIIRPRRLVSGSRRGSDPLYRSSPLESALTEVLRGEGSAEEAESAEETARGLVRGRLLLQADGEGGPMQNPLGLGQISGFIREVPVERGARRPHKALRRLVEIPCMKPGGNGSWTIDDRTAQVKRFSDVLSAIWEDKGGYPEQWLHNIFSYDKASPGSAFGVRWITDGEVTFFFLLHVALSTRPSSDETNVPTQIPIPAEIFTNAGYPSSPLGKDDKIGTFNDWNTFLTSEVPLFQPTGSPRAKFWTLYSYLQRVYLGVAGFPADATADATIREIAIGLYKQLHETTPDNLMEVTHDFFLKVGERLDSQKVDTNSLPLACGLVTFHIEMILRLGESFPRTLFFYPVLFEARDDNDSRAIRGRGSRRLIPVAFLAGTLIGAESENWPHVRNLTSVRVQVLETLLRPVMRALISEQLQEDEHLIETGAKESVAKTVRDQLDMRFERLQGAMEDFRDRFKLLASFDSLSARLAHYFEKTHFENISHAPWDQFASHNLNMEEWVKTKFRTDRKSVDLESVLEELLVTWRATFPDAEGAELGFFEGLLTEAHSRVVSLGTGTWSQIDYEEVFGRFERAKHVMRVKGPEVRKVFEELCEESEFEDVEVAKNRSKTWAVGGTFVAAFPIPSSALECLTDSNKASRALGAYLRDLVRRSIRQLRQHKGWATSIVVMATVDADSKSATLRIGFTPGSPETTREWLAGEAAYLTGGDFSKFVNEKLSRWIRMSVCVEVEGKTLVFDPLRSGSAVKLNSNPWVVSGLTPLPKVWEEYHWGGILR